MKIGDCQIRLPADDPVTFDLDWRHKTATALVNTPGRKQLPEVVRKDSDIRMWRQYLSPRRKIGAKATEYCRQVEGWHDQPAMAGLLEALLLSEASYDQIAGEIGGLDPDAVRLYQAMFFNVRDADGQLNGSLALHARFAQDQQAGANVPARVTWQRAGLNGLKTLATLLNPNRTPARAKVDPIDQLVRQELLRRVLTRQMGTREMLLLQQTQVDIERTRLEMSKHVGQDSEAWDLVHNILGLTRPKLVAPQKHSEEQLQGLRNVQNTEAKIRASQPPTDRGMDGMIATLGADRAHAPKKAAPPGNPS
jgi:hypothetical protein